MSACKTLGLGPEKKQKKTHQYRSKEKDKKKEHETHQPSPDFVKVLYLQHGLTARKLLHDLDGRLKQLFPVNAHLLPLNSANLENLAG